MSETVQTEYVKRIDICNYNKALYDVDICSLNCKPCVNCDIFECESIYDTNGNHIDSIELRKMYMEVKNNNG